MKISIISAVSENLGIGKDGDLPWHIPEDLKFFRRKTINNIVLMGLNTFKSLNYKPLKNRINIVLADLEYIKKNNLSSKLFKNKNFFKNYDENTEIYLDSLTKTYNLLKELKKTKKDLYIIGGASIYNQFLTSFNINYLYITQIYKDFKCDVKFPIIPEYFNIISYSELLNYKDIQYRFLTYKNSYCSSFHEEHKYLTNLKDIIETGEYQENRTGISTYVKYGTKIEFEISKSVPLLTTKKVPWKMVIEELLWMLRGQTDANVLKEKKINIWNGNSTREFLDKRGLTEYPEGNIGAGYGFQWRFFGGKYFPEYARDPLKHKEEIGGFDQIDHIINELKNNKKSRQIVLSAWNGKDLDKMSLCPCHYSVTFNVNNENQLICTLMQRSKDAFLGEPFNIFSYTVLTYILSKKCGLTPGKVILFCSNHHVYTNHVNQCYEQIKRKPMPFPILNLSDNIITKNIEDITIDDFNLIGYFYHPVIKAQMAV